MIAHRQTVAYIGLGSNLGDRAATMLKALTRLSELPGVTVRMVSQMIETEPVGDREQPVFLNAAAELRCELTAAELLERLQRVETELGRVRHEKWGPRTIDLDILLFGSEVVDDVALQVPHPLMHERWFVLKPLSEIAPEVVHPVLGRTVRELLEGL